MASYLNHITNPGTGGYSLLAIPAAWVLAILPHFYAASVSQKFKTPFDNKNPRLFLAKLSQKEKLSIDEGTFIRAEAANANGFENLAFFSCAVVAGNVAKLDPVFLKTMAASYLLSRVAYNFLYINNTTDALAALRSVSFLTGIGICFTLFIKSGLALA